MTDNKLTLQDCCKYPKATILDYTGSKDNPNDYKNIYDYIYKQGLLDGMNLEETAEDIFNDYYICNCKLILRDITQLTGEEKKYINDNFVYELFKDAAGENNWNSFNELFAVCENKLGLINYLREKNIMIEPEDLFKQGKAVKDV